MKNLTTEYNKLTESETPDLWDRINSSLDILEEKAASEIHVDNHEPESSLKETLNDNKKIIPFTKTIWFKSIEILAGCACAALLFIVLLPTFRSKSESATSPGKEATMPSYSQSEAPTYNIEESTAEVAYEASIESEDYYESEGFKETIDDSIFDNIYYGDSSTNYLYLECSSVDNNCFEANGTVYSTMYSVEGAIPDYEYPHSSFTLLTNSDKQLTFEELLDIISPGTDPDPEGLLLEMDTVLIEVTHSY